MHRKNLGHMLRSANACYPEPKRLKQANLLNLVELLSSTAKKLGERISASKNS